MPRRELSLDPTRPVAGSPPVTAPARFSTAGLIAAREDRELVIWRDLDAQPTPLWRPPRGRITTFEVSPAADRLAVVVQLDEAAAPQDVSSLWVVKAATGVGVEIVARERLFGPLVFSPDGAALALTVVGPSELAAGGGTHAVVVRLGDGLLQHCDSCIDFDPHVWNHDVLLWQEYEPLGKLRQRLYAWSGNDAPPRYHEGERTWLSPRATFQIHETASGIFADHADRRVALPWQPIFWVPSRVPWVGEDRLFDKQSIIDLRTGSAVEVTSEYLTLETASPDGTLLVFARDGALVWSQLHEAVLADTPAQPRSIPAPLPRAHVVAMRPHASRSPRIDIAATLTDAETLAVANAWVALARARLGDDALLADALALLDGLRHAESATHRVRCLRDLERELDRVARDEPRLAGFADEMLTIVEKQIRSRPR